MKRGFLITLGGIALVIIILFGISTYQEAKETGRLPEQLSEKANPAVKSGEEATANGETGTPSTEGSGGAKTEGGSAQVSSPMQVQEPPEENRVYCTPESHDIETCDPNDHPVCGWFDTTEATCQEGPCVRSTFPNECEACINPNILYWAESECPIHQ